VRFAEQRFANEADFDAGRRRFNRRAQARAARADDQHVVFVSFVIGCHDDSNFLEVPAIVVQMAGRAEPDINIRETDPKQTNPCPHHVADVQAGDAVVSFGARRRFGLRIEKAANQMPQRMTAKSIHRKENGI